MKKLFKKEVNQELVNYIQRLGYEITMKERIVRQMLLDGGEDVASLPAFKKYENDLAEINAEYMLAQSKMEKMMLPPDFGTYFSANWNLDYSTNLLTVAVDNKDAEKALLANGFSAN